MLVYSAGEPILLPSVTIRLLSNAKYRVTFRLTNVRF